MGSVNKAIVVGKVRSVEPARKAGTGETVVNFTIQTDGDRKQKGTGAPRTVIETHRIAAYKGKADFASLLAPGDIVYVEGPFQYSIRKVGNNQQQLVDILAEKLERVHKVPRDPATATATATDAGTSN